VTPADDDLPWARALDLFQSVVELPPAERSARLAAACAGNEDLRRRVEGLIAADLAQHDAAESEARGRFQRLLGGAAPAPHAADWIGRRLGPFQILAELGSGGMGTVFLGERRDGQVEQRVALKVARLGLVDDEARRRLLVERQILAGLDHPQIARLIDAGVSDAGLPFFAMEYVEGRPIHEFCTAHGLDLAARIRLFLSVCAAVEHAHRRLIVHRDLKPSNILVTAGGEVKLLDFGIAKLLGDGSAGLTRTTDRVLTPAYAAPEQVRGQPVTTATDVYGLGVVLYELLTDRRPFAAAGGDATALALAVLTEQPAKPSTAVLAAPPAESPDPRRRRLRRALRGDLDTIVLTALKKEPERRYPSAATLAEDLRRYLAGLPIRARPDSLRYRAGKFVLRHRLGAAMGAVLLLALVTALVVAFVEARAQVRAARASQAVTAFLVRLFEGADPTRARGAALTAQELLDEGVERLRSDLVGEPAVRARLLHAMAASYVSLGLYDRALPLAAEALRLRRETLPAGSAEAAESMDQLGEIYRLKADEARAEPLLRAALAARRAGLAADDPAVIESLGHLGRLLEDLGRFAAAEEPFRHALAASERRFGKDSVETARRLDDLATNQSDLGRRSAAFELLRRALEIRERKLGPNAPDVAASLHDLGVHLDEAGEYREAVAALERSLAIRRKIFGAGHPLVGATQIALAGAYDDQNRFDEAERSAESALEILRRTLSADHPRVDEALNMLAIIRTDRRDFTGAVPIFRELLARCARVSGKYHPDTLAVENNLAVTLLHTGRAGEAEALQREILAHLPEDNGQSTSVTTRQNLASTLEQEGRPREALALVRQALALQRRREGETSANVAVALRSLAIAEEMSGEAAAAEREFRAALRLGESLARAHGITMYEWGIPLADFLAGAKRCAEARPLLAAALAEIEGARRPVAPIWRLQQRLLAGHCAEGSAQDGEAAKTARAARASLRAIPGVEVDLYPTARALLAAGGPRPPG
jgi:serine/threonine-protein kinase